MKSPVELNSLFPKILFFLSPGLMRDETGDLANEAYFSNPIVSLKQYRSGLKTTNYRFKNYFLLLKLLNNLI